jgi:cytochrome d ubiquinol oxidase subunit I
MDSLVDLSRLQFAITAMYHFMFVPLTLGMTWLLVVMETIYVMTDNPIYKDMTKFWGKLFAINFAIGVTTGLTMEFQFGTNWAYYSHYVGDIFGVPLAIEGLMAFFLESTFVGLFFFAWDRVSKKQHLLITVLVAIGSNLSAMWILIANGWMNAPVGTTFNPVTMRMELSNFTDVLFNPYAQDKFFHTVCAGYVTASIFVLGISSFYLLKKRDLPFARRSFKIAAMFGLFSTIAVVILGDGSGLEVYKAQPSKLVAIEGIWRTEKAPAGWSLFAIPDQKTHTNWFDIKIPAVGSIILTHSLTEPIKGMDEIIAENKQRISRGQQALLLLDKYKANPQDPAALVAFEHSATADLGYGLLLKKYTNDIANATPAMIEKAANSTIPQVAPLFYTFRLMIGLGASFFLLFIVALWKSLGKSHAFESCNWLLRWSLIWIPMPWLACWCGWTVAEYGRQPWTIFGILPTHLSVSTLSVHDLIFSISGFVIIYTILAIIEVWLMFKYARLGPSSLGTGKYHFERKLGLNK